MYDLVSLDEIVDCSCIRIFFGSSSLTNSTLWVMFDLSLRVLIPESIP